jgi:hypothetical protein
MAVISLYQRTSVRLVAGFHFKEADVSPAEHNSSNLENMT